MPDSSVLNVFEEDVDTVAVTSPFSETIKSVNEKVPGSTWNP